MEEEKTPHENSVPESQKNLSSGPDSNPRKILEALDKAQEEGVPAAPKTEEQPASVPEKDPEKEMLIPESMRRLEQMIRMIKEKKP